MLHLDPAGCAPQSAATRAAVAAFSEREAEQGGYTAAAEVAPTLTRLRASLGALAGGFGPDDVAFSPNATAAFASVVAAWPWRAGDRVGLVRSEYGSNRMALVALAARTGLELVELACDGDGRLVAEALDAELERGLALVAFPHIASQRGVLQPAGEVAARCRAAGVPVLLDAAQSLGHVLVDEVGADIVVGTSRKWLRGPRGIGVLAIRPALVGRLRPPLPGLHSAGWADPVPEPLAGMVRFGLGDASVAGQVGLATAVAELVSGGMAELAVSAAGLGQYARAALDGGGGWRVVEPLDEPTGTVTLRHPRLDPAAVWARLYEDHRILASWVPVARAPADLAVPVLRVSLHPGWVGFDDIDRLAATTRDIGRTGL